MRAPLSSLSQFAHSISLAAAYVALMAGMVIAAGCQSGPDDDMEDSEADVEIDAVGEADAEDVDQDPNIGEPMN
jgi:hypothetical protein